jgi:hypothetical protein
LPGTVFESRVAKLPDERSDNEKDHTIPGYIATVIESFGQLSQSKTPYSPPLFSTLPILHSNSHLLLQAQRVLMALQMADIFRSKNRQTNPFPLRTSMAPFRTRYQVLERYPVLTMKRPLRSPHAGKRRTMAII